MKEKWKIRLVIWIALIAVAISSGSMAEEIKSLAAVGTDTEDSFPSLVIVSEPEPAQQASPPILVMVDPPAKEPSAPSEPVTATWGLRPASTHAPAQAPAYAPSADTPKPQGRQGARYTITYVFFDGHSERAISILVQDGQEVPMPLYAPAREGYTFVFWYDIDADLDEDGNLVEYLFGGEPSRDMTLKAYFAPRLAGQPDPEDEKPKWAEPSLNVMVQSEDTIWDLFAHNDGVTKVLPPRAELEPQPEDPELAELSPDVVDMGNAIIWEILGLNAPGAPEPEETPVPIPMLISIPIPAGETIEEEEVALAGPEVTVTITCDAGETVRYGDKITLFAEVSGLGDMAYTATWRYYDGAAWFEVKSGLGLAYQYTLTEENYSWIWEVKLAFH